MVPGRHASLLEELVHDFAAAAVNRFERVGGRSLLGRAWLAWRMLWEAEAMTSIVRYRLSSWLRRHHVPVIPGFFDRWNRHAIGLFIGPPVIVGPGLYIPHGGVVIDGIVTLGRGCVISPWVTIGLSTKMDEEGNPILFGPTIGDYVQIGTGAKLLGPIHVGDRARIGANAVVLIDVPTGATAVGVPARVVEPRAAGAKPSEEDAEAIALAGLG